MSTKQFSVNAVVAKLLKDYVQAPTFEDLRREIEQHKYVELRHHVLMRTPHAVTRPDVATWYAVLHVTSDSVIIQDVLLSCTHTRFAVHVVKLEDWNTVFLGWVDEDHKWYEACHDNFVNGMLKYNAQI